MFLIKSLYISAQNVKVMRKNINKIELVCKAFLWFLLMFSLVGMPVYGASQTKENRLLLEELDEILRGKQKYIDKKNEEINVLKELLSSAETDSVRFQRCKDIVQVYSYVQMDSALHYVGLQKSIAERMKNTSLFFEEEIQRANVYVLMGMYSSAKECLDAIPQELPTMELQLQLWNAYRRCYNNLVEFTPVDIERKKHSELLKEYRDKLLAHVSPSFPDYHTLVVNSYLDAGEYDKFFAYVDDLLKYTTDLRLIGQLHFSLSSAYKSLNEPDLQEKHLILASIAEQKNAVKQYVSLRSLAVLLFKAGDIDRAYAYVRHALRDAIEGNVLLRTIKVSQLYPVIERAYLLKSEGQRREIYLSLLAVSLLALLLLALFFYTLRQLKTLREARLELREANDCLHKNNRMLHEVNSVKEEYLAQYLNQCSLYIDKLDAYRRQLARFAMASKLEDLFKAIKSDAFIEKEIKDFYKQFDSTFLKIYPGFVQSFNSLLQEDAQILPKKGNLLTTELRIFALIRLGIEDSNHIASFLRYSVLTVYNYRSKVRNKAKGDKKEFEKQLMQIGEVG